MITLLISIVETETKSVTCKHTQGLVPANLMLLQILLRRIFPRCSQICWYQSKVGRFGKAPMIDLKPMIKANNTDLDLYATSIPQKSVVEK
jgi:hypothetical protein